MTRVTTLTLLYALLGLTCLSLLLPTAECRGLHRRKRRIDEFGEMILLKCTRSPLDFNGYGNWCGLGGKGETVDAIDGCCKVHDLCYAHINRDECETMLKYRVYTTEYRWSFQGDEITCRDEDPCARELCECDRTAATCFGANQHVYDEANKHSGLFRGVSRLLGMNG